MTKPPSKAARKAAWIATAGAAAYAATPVPFVQAAFDVLKRYNLMGDSELKSLIELRRGNNPILTKEVKWTACHELSVSLEMGVDLALPGISKGGNLAANLKIASNSMLTWRVEFAAN